MSKAKSLTELQEEIDQKRKEVQELEVKLKEKDKEIKELQQKGLDTKKFIEENNKLINGKITIAQSIFEAESKVMEIQAQLDKRKDYLSSELTKSNQILQSNPSPAELKLHQGRKRSIEYETKTLAEHNISKEREANKEYINERDKLFEIVTDLLKNQSSMEAFLLSLAPKSGDKQTGISQFDAVLGGIGFAVKNFSTLASIATSASFYKAEGQKLNDILTGAKPYNPANEPFFLKLMQDQKLVQLLSQNKERMNDLLNIVVPKIIPVVLAELGKIDAINEEIQQKGDRFKKLPELTQQLEELKAKPRSKDNIKAFVELETEVKELKSLQNKKQLADTMQALKKAGLTEEFIAKNLLPIVIGPLKTIINDPAKLSELIRLGAEYIKTQDQNRKTELLFEIVNKVELGKLLESTNLTKLLNEQGENVAKIATAAINSNEKLKQTMEKAGVTNELINTVIPVASPLLANTIPIVAEVANKVLSNPKGVNSLVDNFNELQTLNKQESMLPLSPKEKAQQNKALEGVITGVAGVVTTLKPTLDEKLPTLLNDPALSKVAATLVEQGPVAEIVKPLGINKDFVEKVLPEASPLMSKAVPIVTEAVSNVLSNPQGLTNLSNNLTELGQLNEKAKDKPLSDIEKAQQNKALEGVITGVAGVVTNLKPTLEKLPALPDDPNLTSLTNVAAMLVEQGPVADIAKSLKITDVFVKKVLPEAAPLVSKAAPILEVVSEVINQGLANLPSNLTELGQLNKKAKDSELSAEEKDKQKVLEGAITGVAGVVANLKPTLDKQLQELLQDPNLTNVVATIVGQERVAKIVEPLEIKKEFVEKVLSEAAPLISKAVPIVTEVVSEVLKDSQGLANLSSNLTELDQLNKKAKDSKAKGSELSAEEKTQQTEALKGVITGIAGVVTNLKPTLDKKLPTLLNDPALTQVAATIVKQERVAEIVKPLGIDEDFVKNVLPEAIPLISKAVPIVTEVVSEVLKDPQGLVTLSSNLTELGQLNKKAKDSKAKGSELSAEEKAQQTKALEGVITGVAGIVTTLKPTLEKLPELLKDPNLTSLTTVAATIVEQKGVAKIVEPLGIKKEFVEKVLPEAAPLVSKAVPIVTEVASAVLSNPQGLTNLPSNLTELGQLNKKAKDGELSEEEKDKQKALEGAITGVAGVITNLKPTLDKQLQELLQDPNLTKVAATIVKQERVAEIVKPLGIDEDFVKNVLPSVTPIIATAVPIVTEVASAVLSNPHGLANLSSNLTELGQLNKKAKLSDTEKTQQTMAMLEIGKNIVNIVSNLPPKLLDEDVPNLLKNNKANVSKVIEEVANRNPYANTLESMGVKPDLLKRAADVGLDIVADILPEANKFFKKPQVDDLQKLITQAQDVMSSPEGNIMQLVQSVVEFKKKYPELENAIEKNIPEILMKQERAAKLGPVIDDFLNSTAIGRKYNIKGQKLIETLAPKAPKLLKIGELYANKQYVKMAAKSVGLLFDKDVLGLALNAVFTKKDIKNLEPLTEKKAFKDTELAKATEQAKEAKEGLSETFKETKKGLSDNLETAKKAKEALTEAVKVAKTELEGIKNTLKQHTSKDQSHSSTRNNTAAQSKNQGGPNII
jgi:hypothetical protein